MTRGVILLALALTACDSGGGDARAFPFGPGDEGKEDVFGRRLVGVAAPYHADPGFDEAAVRADHGQRRAAAWRTVTEVLGDVPLLGLAELDAEHPDLVDGDLPTVPRFETWYGVDDLKRMFQHLYEGLGPSGRAAHAPFSDEALDEALVWNAHALDRSDRWPLERFFAHVEALGDCPDDLTPDACAQHILGGVGGAAFGNGRIVYSPATARHLLREYPRILACLAELDAVPVDGPESAPNFSLCFTEELPSDAVLVKAQWVRAEAGVGLPVFETSGEALARRLAGTADWGSEGDRKVEPAPGDIYTIRLRDGSVFRLAGLHIMSKEARHWQWVSLWFSDAPDQDFGADRPATLTGPWQNYKMCTVAFYAEEDSRVRERFAAIPSLASALEGVGAEAGAPTWCSNPYIEHGRGNASTNCIGCHQHGGATRTTTGDSFVLERIIDDETRYPAHGRTQQRTLFPADYLYSFSRVDDFAHVFANEASHFDRSDTEAVRPRIEAVLAETAVAASGEPTFTARCTGCHGPQGMGGGFAPSLYDRVPRLDDRALLRSLIAGKGAMPAWGERLTDQELADLLGHLRTRFGNYAE
jgi:mono/diheme cytochrome c family protein